ncbi:TA2R7 protein, partial [Machaerirhynchus nigripectus]|nr:TA2R7 protein [Machaerirhynchus nigripectus]
QQSNVTSFSATTLAIITLEAFAGMWINAFIVCVLCIAWVKKKALNSNEKIVLLLGYSRFWHLCFSWAYCSLSVTYANYFYVQPTFQLTVFFQSFSNCSNLWFSACLCVFYCIKIANFRNSCFIYLKVKIDRIVPWLLLGSVLSALAVGITGYDNADKKLSNSHNYTRQGDVLKLIDKTDKYFFHLYFIYGFGFVTSFTAVIVSALLLLFSLWRHKRTMQTNSMNSLSVDAHIRAMKSILSFFIMYSINFVFLILSLISSTKEEKYVVFLSLLFLYAFPGFHSLILILSNPKLEKTLIRILSCLKCKVCMK